MFLADPLGSPAGRQGRPASPGVVATPARPRTAKPTHVLCFLLLSMVLACVLLARMCRPIVLSESPEAEGTLAQQVERRIDPNTASWPELARLPGIGEVLARRIVAYREQCAAAPGAAARAGIVFRRPEDLTVIRGIGAKAPARRARYLKFPVSARAPGG